MNFLKVLIVFILVSCGDGAEERKKATNSSLNHYTLKSEKCDLYEIALCSKRSFSDKFLLDISQVKNTRSLMICGNLTDDMSVWTCCNNKKISLTRHASSEKCYIAELPDDVELFNATFIRMSNQDQFSLSGLEE
jgi:hypothetical protein